MSKRSHKIVVSDTTLIINLIHAGMLCLLGAIPGYFFVVPEEVVEEVTYPDQAQSLLDALEQGWLASESITDPREIELYTYFRAFLGKGEAACLALAEMRGWLIATDDERKGFPRIVEERIGKGMLINTPGLFVLAIRAGNLSIEKADSAKAVLEKHRFRMKFKSFREIV